MPKHDTCPKHIELDIYKDCPYGCIYCISKTIDHSFDIDLQKEINTIRNLGSNSKPYYFSPWTDSYPPEEAKNKYTRQLLFELAQRNVPFFVITKSPLVLRDIKYFKNRENAFIAISLNCLNNDIIKVFEPNAPTATERKKLIEELVKTDNVKTVVKIDPVIPGVTDNKELAEITDWLCEIKPYAVTIETLRLSNIIVEAMKTPLPENTLSGILKYYNKITNKPKHPKLKYRVKMFKEAEDKFKKAGVKISFCRASMPAPVNENDCRGGYNYDY